MFGECAIINIYLVREGVQIQCCYCWYNPMTGNFCDILW